MAKFNIIKYIFGHDKINLADIVQIIIGIILASLLAFVFLKYYQVI